MSLLLFSTAGMNTVPRFLVARASALNDLIRSMAASLGIAYLTYVMMSKQIFHAALLSQSVTYSSPGTIMAMSSIGALTGKPGGGVSTESLMVIAG